jgi:L-asparaginase/beta-aspartyl-peptidase (threonine type)
VRAVLLCHGGVGAPVTARDGAEVAAQGGAGFLKKSAVDAVVAATVALEDDPRFNAGTGANLRLDGHTVEMDAGLMDFHGHVGAVAAIRGVRNPILAARAVLESPHDLIVGEGATRLARKLGLPRSRRVPARTVQKFRGVVERLIANHPPTLMHHWRGDGWRRFWNFPGDPPGNSRSAGSGIGGGGPSRRLECDTVGAVAMDSKGRFAAASSTGGTQYMLMGRVGDSPLIGCGFYAGPAGAVTATGLGEEIARRLLSFRIYLRMESGVHPQMACEEGVKLFPHAVPIGILAVTAEGEGFAANRQMPAAGVAFDTSGRLIRIGCSR